MLSQRNKKESTNALGLSGFTIVELLIVVVVIGILAALVLNTFSSAQKKANDVSIGNDLGNIAKKVKAFHVDNGHYPITHTHLESSQIKIADQAYTVSNNLLYCFENNSSPQQFAVLALSKSGKPFIYSATEGGPKEFTHEWTHTGTINCPNAGIANYAWSWGYTNGAWSEWTK